MISLQPGVLYTSEVGSATQFLLSCSTAPAADDEYNLTTLFNDALNPALFRYSRHLKNVALMLSYVEVIQ